MPGLNHLDRAIAVDGADRPPADSRAAASLLMPDSLLIRGVYRALMMAGPCGDAARWRDSELGATLEVRINLSRVLIEVRAGSPAEARRIISNASPLALDLAVVLLSADSPSARIGPRLIRAAEVLDAKGYRRWGSERRALERQLAAELELLSGLRLAGGDEPLFKILPLKGSGCDFVYEPGEWLKRLFAEAPLRLLDRRILEFDHRLNRAADALAKKLAIHFTLSTGMRGSAAHSMGALMTAIGLSTQDLASRRGRGGRLADRFEEALLRLRECDLFDVRYRGSQEACPSERVKGWISHWLQMDLIVTAIRSRPDLQPPCPAQAEHLHAVQVRPPLAGFL